MAQQNYVIVISDDKPPEAYLLEHIAGKTVAQLKVILNIKKGYALAIRTPTFIQYLEPDIVVTDMCKDIATTDTFNYSYALQIINKKDKNSIQFIFQCEVDNTRINSKTKLEEPIPFPNFIVNFNLNEFKTKNGNEFLNKIVSSFELPIENPRLSINGQLIDFSKTRSIEIIRQLRVDKSINVFKCLLTESALGIAQKRIEPMEELINTEGIYIQRLIFIFNWFQPRIEKADILGKNEGSLDSFYQACKNLCVFHSSFHNSISKLGRLEYGTSISRPFFEMGESFLINQKFVVVYQKIQETLSAIRGNEKLNEIEQSSFMEEKISFDQFASAPFQRPMKYPLLLREIKKVTPKCHIDYRFVCIAESQMKGICSKIESYCDQLKDYEEMLKILNRMVDKEVDVANKNHSIKGIYECKVVTKEDKNKKKPGMIYLFSDKILCNKRSGHGKSIKETVVFYSKIKNQAFIVSADQGPASILFIGKRQECINVIFESPQMRDEFHENLREIRQNLMILRPHQIFAEEIRPTSHKNIPIPRMAKPSVASISDTALFYTGGYTDGVKDLCSPVITFDSKGEEFSVETNAMTHVKGMRMASSAPQREKCSYRSLYLFGGAETPSIFTFDHNVWRELPGKANFTRVGHTLVAYEDNLVVFGGRDDHDNLCNDTWMYNVTKHLWSKPIIKRKMPPPRYNHSAVIYKNVMIIHGGKYRVDRGDGMFDEEKLNDTWVFSFDKNEWAKVKLRNCNAIVPRSDHAAVIINQFMVVFGGEGFNNLPFAMNIETLEVIDLQFKGNYIRGMNKMAAASVLDTNNLNEKQIICFGGCINDNKSYFINSFTRFFLPEEITKPDPLPSSDDVKIEINEEGAKLVKLKRKSSYNITASMENFELPVDKDCFK